MKPLLSIIIPNYNNSIYLKECLDKIINQTYRPLEVVVVDDCSIDNSKNIIYDFSKRYNWVKGVFLDKNRGVSHARNIGVENAHGKYITFLDSDDYYVNKKKLALEMGLLILKQKEGEAFSAAFSELIAVDREGKELWKYRTKASFKGRTLKRTVLEGKNIQLPRDFCMKKEFHEKIGGFDESSSLYEDTDYLMRLSNIINFYCTGELGSAYRITGKGLSSASQKAHQEAMSKLRCKYSADFKKIEWIWIVIVFRVKNIYDFAKQFIKRRLLKNSIR